jgi:hypothetical protein
MLLLCPDTNCEQTSNSNGKKYRYFMEALSIRRFGRGKITKNSEKIVTRDW